jgi:hypothetical protein
LIKIILLATSIDPDNQEVIIPEDVIKFWIKEQYSDLLIPNIVIKLNICFIEPEARFFTKFRNITS